MCAQNIKKWLSLLFLLGIFISGSQFCLSGNEAPDDPLCGRRYSSRLRVLFPLSGLSYSATYHSGAGADITVTTSTTTILTTTTAATTIHFTTATVTVTITPTQVQKTN